MKKIFAILFLSIAALSNAQNITTFTNATSLIGTDLFYLARSPFGSTNDMKLTWATLADAISDSCGGFNYLGTLKYAETNPWYSNQVFEGPASVTFLGSVTATYAKFLIPNSISYTDWKHFGYAGTDGSSYLCFNYGSTSGQRDTMLTSRVLRAGFNGHIVPLTNLTYNLGAPGRNWLRIYADTLYLGTVPIWHTGTTINIGGPIIIGNGTDTLMFDGATISSPNQAITFKAYALSEKPYNFTLITDTVITITGGGMPSSILIDSHVSASGVDSIDMPEAINGQLFTITNNAAYTVVLKNQVSEDGNLRMGSDFSMGEGDIITFKYKKSTNVWYQVSRSDN